MTLISLSSKVPIYVCDSNTAMELALALEKLNNQKLLNLHKVIYFFTMILIIHRLFTNLLSLFFFVEESTYSPQISCSLSDDIHRMRHTVTYRILLICNYRLLMKTMMCN